MKKLYATWRSYLSVTNMGAKKEVLKSSYGGVMWMSGPGYAPARTKFASLYYGTNGTTMEHDGQVNGGYYAERPYSARPALYG